MINHSFRVGFSFGSASGIITTLGLMIGLYSGTNSKIVILSGILTIAIADAFSDALGIHISEESEIVHSAKEIWQSTVSTFLAKLIFSLSFAVPILMFPILPGIIAGAMWGVFLLGIFSYYIAKEGKKKPAKVIAEHLAIALLVVVITYYVGRWINAMTAGQC